MQLGQKLLWACGVLQNSRPGEATYPEGGIPKEKVKFSLLLQLDRSYLSETCERRITGKGFGALPSRSQTGFWTCETTENVDL